MQPLVIFLVLILIAVPIAIIYLLITVSGLKSETSNLKKQMNIIALRMGNPNKMEQPEQQAEQSYIESQTGVQQAEQNASARSNMGVGKAPIYTNPYIEDSPMQKQEPQNNTTYTASAPNSVYNRPVAHSNFEKKQKENDSVEGVIGRNVLGICASVLVFIGLIFLGILVYEHINDTIKIVLMFLVSTVLTVTGILLSYKKKNSFTTILTGCGCGAFFISILITHIYFHAINDIVAFSLLLVWMIIALFIAKITDSMFISSLVHVGAAISICFAFGLGFVEDKIIILLIYQIAAILVLILGNMLMYKKTYNLAVAVSIVLAVISSGFMLGFYLDKYNTMSLPIGFMLSVFVFQFVGISFLSYLLAVCTHRIKTPDYQFSLHIYNKICFVIATVINVFLPFFKLFGENNLDAWLFISLIGIGIMIGHCLVTLAMSRVLDFKVELQRISIILLSVVSALLLMLRWSNAAYSDTLNIPVLIAVSVILLIIWRITKDNVYVFGANIILGVDAMIMIFAGYHSINKIGTIASSFGYMLLYFLILISEYLLLDKDERFYRLDNLKTCLYLLANLSIFSILSQSNSIDNYKSPIILLALTVLTLAVIFLKIDKSKNQSVELSALSVLARVAGYILFISSLIYIAFAYSIDITEMILSWCVVLTTVILAFVRMKKAFENRDNIEIFLFGLKMTLFILALVNGFTSWFDSAYVLSIVTLIIALLCIVLGFTTKTKYIRIYGLVLTLTAVAKIVLIDVSGIDTLLRVITFIGGGLICFAISAIYSYVNKKLLLDEVYNANKE